MNRVPLLLALLAGCTTAGDDYPVQVDQPGTAPPASSQLLASRVCVIADPRALATCSVTGAGGLVVSAGGTLAQTAPDGSFTLSSPHPIGGTLAVSGAGVVPTQLRVSSVGTSIPVLQADLFEQMLAANQVAVTPGTGSVFATVTRGGLPAAGVTVSTTPIGAAGPFFDGTTATGFALDGTGTRGIVWAPGIASGTTSLTFTDIAHASETTVGGVQVVDGGVTLTDAILE